MPSYVQHEKLQRYAGPLFNSSTLVSNICSFQTYKARLVMFKVIVLRDLDLADEQKA
jgi:hypothetical protein